MASRCRGIVQLTGGTDIEALAIGEVCSRITGQAERCIGTEQTMLRARQAGLRRIEVVRYVVVVGVETKNALAIGQDSIQHQIQIGITGQAQFAIGGACLAGKTCDAGVVISERIVVAGLAIA